MKKFMLIGALLTVCAISFSQDHLTFKGIEINGTLTEFSKKLEASGFKKTYTNDAQDACVLEGSFAGFDECRIFVLSTAQEHIVWKVAVLLPEQSSWYSLKSRYNDFKSSLTEKYGAPDKKYEYFSSPYYEGDGYEISALNNDKCTYATYFYTDLGTVGIDLEGGGYGKGQVRIMYTDATNAELNEKSKKASVIQDL